MCRYTQDCLTCQAMKTSIQLFHVTNNYGFISTSINPVISKLRQLRQVTKIYGFISTFLSTNSIYWSFLVDLMTWPQLGHETNIYYGFTSTFITLATIKLTFDQHWLILTCRFYNLTTPRSRNWCLWLYTSMNLTKWKRHLY